MKKDRRSFSKEFKLNILSELKSGNKTMVALAKKHNLEPIYIYRWKKQLESGKLSAKKLSNNNKILGSVNTATTAEPMSESQKERIKKLAIELIMSL